MNPNLPTVAAWCYGIAGAGYAAFALYLGLESRGGLRSLALTLAACLTAVWAFLDLAFALTQVSPLFEVGAMADHKAMGFPLRVTELDPVEMRVRRMFHHWNQLPPSPCGTRPILRISSASHMDARISSSVPASRPRISSPASVCMSRLMSASRITAIAAGGRADAFGACAPATDQTRTIREL